MKLFQVALFRILVLALFLMLAATGCGGGGISENAIILDDNNGADYNPDIDPANFTDSISHPFFNLTPGRVWIYEGKESDGETERIQVEVTQDAKTVLGVKVTVVRDRVWQGDELVEDTRDWYAQDRDGNVWYFGEDVDNYQNGRLANHSGSWESGVNGAKAGIIMKANPMVGDAYRQEFLRGQAEDIGEVLSLNESITTSLGGYQNCLKTKDWTPLEPRIVEHKTYCREVGNVVLETVVTGGSGQVELIEVRTQ